MASTGDLRRQIDRRRAADGRQSSGVLRFKPPSEIRSIRHDSSVDLRRVTRRLEHHANHVVRPLFSSRGAIGGRRRRLRVLPAARSAAVVFRSWSIAGWHVWPRKTRRPQSACASRTGSNGSKLNVRLTERRPHVLFHDAALDGKSNAQGTIKQHTLAELKEVDAGSWFARRFAGAKLLELSEYFRAGQRQDQPLPRLQRRRIRRAWSMK